VDIKLEKDKPYSFLEIFKNYSFNVKLGDSDEVTNEGADANVINFMKFDTTTTEESVPWGWDAQVQKVIIKFHGGTEDIWEDLTGTIKQMVFSEESYHKTRFRVSAPDPGFALIEGETGDNMNNLFKKNYSYYNFQLPSYDAISKEIPEFAMPSFLFAMYGKKYDNAYSKNLLTNNSPTLQTLISHRAIESSNNSTYGNKYIFNEYSGYEYDKNYFIQYSNAMATALSTAMPAGETIFSSYWSNIYKRNLASKYDFHVPFYNLIQIPRMRSDGKKIRKALKGYHFSNIIMKYVHAFEPRSDIEGNSVWNLDDFLFYNNSISDNKEEFRSDGASISLYDVDRSDIETAPSADSLDVILTGKKGELLEVISDIIKDERLTLSDIMFTGGACYSEPVFTKIEKRRTSSGQLAQTFYFFDELDDWDHPTKNSQSKEFLDTQIRYGTEYEYVFYSYFVVCSFDVVPISATVNKQDLQMDLEYYIVPRLKLVESHIGTFTTTVVAPPPCNPIVKISNYVNKNNKIKISLSDRLSRDISKRNRKEIITINDSDLSYKTSVESYAKSMYPYSTNIASYGKYEIYRTDVKPTSYSDFAGKLIQTITSQQSDIFERKRIKSKATIHYLEHDKKYYYLFRALNHQDGYSNPSPIYEIQKIKDADETILNVKAFNFNNESMTSYDTSFRKFMKISYPPIHTSARAFNSNGDEVNNTAIGSTLSLGDEERADNLWRFNSLSGSYIKLRVESKSTGKKIDFNLVFNYSQPENN
tara:strand:- start:6169 stop:8445 length:2277 start_codon:yes stop_codon:yes gene_type:complete